MEQQHFLLISKDMALYGAIAAAFADEGWLLHQTTTAVEGVAKIQKHSYSGILWDFMGFCCYAIGHDFSNAGRHASDDEWPDHHHGRGV